MVALWREALLAKAVLEGKTKGYRSHPQLQRFREQQEPIAAINAYLHAVFEEGRSRGYRFSASKLSLAVEVPPMKVSLGQLLYEWQHLLSKLSRRDPERWRNLCEVKLPDPHRMMKVIPGDIEFWERPKY